MQGCLQNIDTVLAELGSWEKNYYDKSYGWSCLCCC